MASIRINPNRPSIRLSPVHSRNNSRSTSPERSHGTIYQQLDPLLSNLSPESTLHALTSTDAVPSNEQGAHDILSRSISQVSPAERALGIRAAVAAQNLGLWHKEVQSWDWPSQDDAKVGKGFLPSSASHHDVNSSPSGLLSPPVNPDESYYGSLSASVVERYESRIDEIRDGMDNLNVEELKEHVLNAHIPSRSRPSSSTSCVSVPPPLSYVQLSDFTAVITATILRALPHLSRLNALLSTWDVRLFVLRQIPGLLRELTLTRAALDSSFLAIRTPHSFAADPNRYSDAFLSADHVKLESAVVAVGRRMDRVLDALEGRLDSLPEQWIDDLEAIESDFAAWVVEAEKYKVQHEWLRSKADAQMAAICAAAQLQQSAGPLEDEARQDATSNTTATVTVGDETRPLSKQGLEHDPEHQCDLGLPAPDARETTSHSVEDSTVSPEASANGNASQKLRVSTSISKPQIKATQGDLTPMVVTENLDTPTQSDFPPAPTMNRHVLSPTLHTSCAIDPDLENKENIPPPGSQPLDGAGSPPSQASAKSSPLSEHQLSPEEHHLAQPSTASQVEVRLPGVPVSVDVPVMEEVYACVDRKSLPREMIADQRINDSSREENSPSSSSKSTEFTSKSMDSPIGQASKSLNGSSEQNGRDTPVAAFISPVLTPNRSESRLPKPRPSIRGSQIPMAVASPKSGSNSTPIKSQHPNEAKAESGQRTVRKPLQSPIKLSKSRPGKLDLDKDAESAHKVSHRRRTSTGSVGSLLSDHSSLMSSPDVPEPRTASSNVTSLGASPLPRPIHPSLHEAYTLREDRLRRLENQKPDPRITFQQNRTVSLPLERFINERLELGLGGEPASDVAVMKPSMTRSVTPVDSPHPPKVCKLLDFLTSPSLID